MQEKITPEMLLNAYASGYFPMAETRNAQELYWFYPEVRGILPLDGFHVPRSLEKLLRKHPFTIRKNTAFEQVMRACAAPRPERPESWINEEIITLYTQLHHMGYAHSVEAWREEPAAPAGGPALSHASGEGQQARSRSAYTLVGGLYGVALGGAFFGESMFSHESGASKVALVHLVQRLKHAGYTLLDAQYSNPHLVQFGVQEIPRKAYLQKLRAALQVMPKEF
ncbi:MAG: leucyl/phenylalanyl-tRNA--protein transferase [Proteobacteria bacterium]|nr:leucyl/phenylalanyl-tRNA--protein transferase [Pseudomonadota bacterium]